MAGSSGTLSKQSNSNNSGFRLFRELEVWQLARQLASLIYTITREFPSSEQFGLTSQLRRAAVSISSNIAEGHGRRLDGAFVQFLRISIGSANEVESLAVIACDQGFLSENQLDEITASCQKLTVKLSNFITALGKNRGREIEGEYKVD